MTLRPSSRNLRRVYTGAGESAPVLFSTSTDTLGAIWVRSICTYDEALDIAIHLAAPRRIIERNVWTKAPSTATLADDVRAAIDLPPFARAMMDGFAVHRSDIAGTQPLQVVADIHAGEQPKTPVSPGTAVQIRTGAPVPENTAAVVRKEWTEWIDAHTIRLLRPISAGESIQPRGQDTAQGAVLLSRGAQIDGQTIAVLRAAGVTSIPIYAPVRVGIVSTGSELVTDPTKPLCAAQVYAASDAFLQSTLEALGAQVVDISYVDDHPERIEQRAARFIADGVDYVLLTGGASVGDTDYATSVIRRLCGTEQLPIERVWMRPGSPFLAGRAGRTTVFGLSGNPAACFVQFHVLVLPAIRRSLGIDAAMFAQEAVLTQSIRLKPIKHVRFYRATAGVDGVQVRVEPQVGQSSGLVTGLACVNAIIRLDEQVYEAGDIVPIQLTRTTTGRLF